MKQFANAITSFLLDEKIIEIDELEIYRYGTEQILINFMVFGSISINNSMNNMKEMILIAFQATIDFQGRGRGNILIKHEVRRYFKSRFTLILTLVLVLIILGSYYSSYLEKLEWIEVYHSGAVDVDMAKVKAVIDGYSGTGYFEKFIFSNDFFVGFWIVVLIGFGLSIGSSVYDELRSNYGTMVMARMAYKEYLKNVLVARMIYMTTYLSLFFGLVFLETVVFLGGGFAVPKNSYINCTTLGGYLAALGLIVFHMITYVMIMILITTVSSVWIKNNHVIQMLPFIVVIVTYIIGNTLGNVNALFADLSFLIVIDSITGGVKAMVVDSKYSAENIMTSMAFITVCVVIFVIIFRTNVDRYSRDYIL